MGDGMINKLRRSINILARIGLVLFFILLSVSLYSFIIFANKYEPQESDRIYNIIIHIKESEVKRMNNEHVEKEEEVEVNSSKNEYEVYEITAYTAGYESTGKTSLHPEYGVTASGERVKENHTIACPPSMEFGTEVYIPDLDNTYVCEDRGSAITEGYLDIYMPDLDEALKFGRQKLKVLVKEKD